jgi:hypothetical protein
MGVVAMLHRGKPLRLIVSGALDCIRPNEAVSCKPKANVLSNRIWMICFVRPFCTPISLCHHEVLVP